MAVRILVTATDRLGRRLQTVAVEGATFDLTYEKRAEVYKELKCNFAGPHGEEPFIFTKTSSTSN